MALVLTCIGIAILVFVRDYPFFPQALLRAALIPFVFGVGYETGASLWMRLRGLDTRSAIDNFGGATILYGIAIVIIVILLLIFGR